MISGIYKIQSISHPDRVYIGIEKRKGKPGCKHTEETKQKLREMMLERHRRNRSYRVI
jgi:hypothetical protein